MRFTYEELEGAPLIVNAIYEGGAEKNPAADDPLTKLFRLNGYSKSVGNRGGFRKSRKESNGKVKDQLAYTVMFSTGKVEEWPDFLDETNGTFIYYGDNKTPGNNYLDTKQRGNIFLKDVFEKAYGSQKERREIPPIFIFESTGVGMNVQFKGVAVPGLKGRDRDETLKLKKFGNPPNQFLNFEAHFTILSEHMFDKEWLFNLKDYKKDSLIKAPKEWVKYIEGGPFHLDSISYESPDKSIDQVLRSEKDYVRKTRVTQGRFREELLKESPCCKICGLTTKRLLTASHIKPWKDCNDEERVDFFNGFLLCPSHNALFDQGLITIDHRGEIILSDSLDKNEYHLLNIKSGLFVDINESHSNYLEWHQSKVFF